jgi:hypothetical protein
VQTDDIITVIRIMVEALGGAFGDGFSSLLSDAFSL